MKPLGHIRETRREKGDGRHLAAFASVETLVSQLQDDGLVVLPSLLPAEDLLQMQTAFTARLSNLRWNNFDGYQRTEIYRHMIEDVLLLAQGFVDLAIHPLVKEILRRYLGPAYQLVEAKGWKSLPTRSDFHGWHGDMWYDQTGVVGIQRELKLAMYLTDVRTGAFRFAKGTHQKQHPHSLKHTEVNELAAANVVDVTGAAGTAFLFDTSIIHRQAVPMLEPRQAVFYAYHDPAVRLQQEDVDYYRYHPLLLNAAFLGNLSPEDERILGFGDQRNFQLGFVRKGRPPLVNRACDASLGLRLRMHHWAGRLSAAARRMRGYRR